MFKIITKLFASDKRFLIGLILITCLSSQGYSQAIGSTDEGEVVLPFTQTYLDQYNAALDKKAADFNRTFRSRSKAVAFNNSNKGPNTVGACNLITCGSFEKGDVNGGTFRTAIGGTNGQYQADAKYTCWNDDGTVDWSEGQYISYSTTNANSIYPGIIKPSTFDGGGFAIFSFRNEAIRQTLTVIPNTVYTVCFEIAVIPRYNTVGNNNQGGSIIEYIPDLDFGVRNGAVVISDPLTYTEANLIPHTTSDFPSRLSFSTSGPNQNPGGWTEINPLWENRCITFKSGPTATSVEVFYKTGNPGRSVVLVDGLRLSVEGYANAPVVSPDTKTYCAATPVQLDTFVTSQTPPGAQLKWSTNSDPTVTGDHLSLNPTVTPPGVWYAFYFNPALGCVSPAKKLTLSLTNLAATFTKENVSCNGLANGSIDLSVTGGSTPYTYAWTTTNGSGLNSTSQDQSGLTAGTYNVTITDNNGCSVQKSVVIQQPAAIPPPISTGNITACRENPIQTLNANDAITPVNGQTITWYNQAVNGTEVQNPILNTVGTITYYAESYDIVSKCYSITRTPVTLTITAAPSAPVSGGDKTECEASPIQTLTATATVPGGQTIVWYTAATGGTVVSSPIRNTVGSVTYYAQANVNNGGCSSLTRTPVTLTITAAPSAPVSGGNKTECEASPIQTLTATATVPAGQTVVWYTAATGGTVVSSPIRNTVGSVTYYAQTNVNNGGCSSLTRTPVTLTITAAPSAPVSGGDQAQCASNPIQTLTATATVPAGQTVVWYDQASGGNTVTPTWNTIGSITYYAQANVNNGGCNSLSRTAVTLTLNNCGIQLEKIANPNNPQGCTPVAPGEAISYTFNVSNPAGNSPIYNVELKDLLIDPTNNPIPGPVSGDTSNPGILDAGETWVYTASYIVTQPDITNGQVQNTATVSGLIQTSGNPYPVSNSDTVTVNLCQDAQMSIVKSSTSATGDCISFEVGNTIDYKFIVTNEGDVDINSVVVTDPLFLAPNPIVPIVLVSGDNGDGILNVGEIWTFNATYEITQDDVNAGSVVNTAEVNGNSVLGAVDTATSNTVTVLICQSAKIAIVKSSVYDPIVNGECTSEVGDLIAYTFKVTNEGNVDLSDIRVTDPLLELPNPVVAIAYQSGDDGDGILEDGEEWIYTANYAITQTDLNTGSVTNQATAVGTPPVGSDVDDLSGTTVNNNEATVTEICQSAKIAIVKSSVYDPIVNGDCTSEVGDLIAYTFKVTNEGNVDLSNIRVTDPLLELPNPVVAIAYQSGDDGDGILENGEEWIYTANYAITQDDIDTGSVTNQATAVGTPPVGDDVNDLSGTSVNNNDATVTEICQSAHIAIVKTGVFNDVDGNQCADAGIDTITYTFTVTNAGNVSLSNILVTDPLLTAPNPVVNIVFQGGDTDGDGELDVTETWIYTATSYTITQDDIDTGSVTNQATAVGTPPVGDDVDDLSGTDINNDDATVIDLCQNPDIAIVKTGVFNDENGNDCSDVDETITYTFTVTNEGNVSLSNVTVTDPLIATITGPTGDTDADGELDVTETWIYTGSYSITQDDIDLGEVKNQATAEGTAPDATVISDLSDESSVLENDPTITELCQNPAIAIVKTGIFNDLNGNDCSDIDETISYTFTVTNEGNVSLSDVIVTDPLIATITGPTGDTDGDGELDVTETWIYTGTYSITQEDIDAGEVINQATVKANDPMDNAVIDLSDESSVLENDPTIIELCQNPAIAIVKTGIFNDENQNDCSDVDETITYTFTVTNEGNVSLSNVTVTDPMIATITGPTGDTDGDGELDVTEVWIYTGTYAITQGDIDAGQVTNQATAEGTAPDTTVVSDLSDESSVLEDDPTVIELCQNPKIALIKTGVVNDTNGNGCADVDETISYTFTVFNLGNVTLSNVTVTDPLVSVVGGPITLTPGATDGTSFTATYTITQVDIDAGEVINQATATGADASGTTVSDLSDDNSELEDDPTITQLCQNPAIALIKVGVSVDENGNGCADLGETILYSFSVKNTGNVALTNVTVTDPLVAVVGGPISLAAGQEDVTTFTAVYTITQTDVDTGFIENQATADGTAPNGDMVSDQSDNNSYVENDPTITDLCQNPSISLEKTGVFNDENGNGASEVGETISYSFSVTNTGNVTLYNIMITDPLPGIQIFGGPIAILQPGETDDTTFTAIYVINDLDILNLEVVNQATVTGEDINGTIVTDDSDDPADLTNSDNNGDGDPDDPTVVILPNVLGVNFEIFNGITPNGDGINDFFLIQGISDYPENNVKIFNRWGVLVFETDGYGGSDDSQNVFRGISEGRVTVQENKELPTGTYFYILTFQGENPGKDSYNGYLYINR